MVNSVCAVPKQDGSGKWSWMAVIPGEDWIEGVADTHLDALVAAHEAIIAFLKARPESVWRQE